MCRQIWRMPGTVPEAEILCPWPDETEKLELSRHLKTKHQLLWLLPLSKRATHLSATAVVVRRSNLEKPSVLQPFSVKRRRGEQLEMIAV